jgi:HAMP domain-containing protein
MSAGPTQIAYLIVAVAIILGMAATLVVLGSILVPLRRLVSAMEGITAGDLNVPIPAAARNAIVPISNTLRLHPGIAADGKCYNQPISN